MADDYSISYSYQTGGPAEAPAKPAPTDQELYAFIDCERVNLQNSGVMLIHRHSDRQLIVAPEVSVALGACTTFRSLADHVEVLTSTIPQLAGQQENVAQVLGMVKDAGLLVSADEVAARISPETTDKALNLPATRVFIITCDRPAAVQRLLQSMVMAGNLARHEELFLIDDSRQESNAELNRQLVETFNTNSPRDMHYVGRTAQKRLMDGLIAELPAQENAIRFLIDHERWAENKTYGLARTLCLLLSVDRRVIVMDDDVICAAVASPHKREGLEFSGIGRQTDFYTSEQDILARTEKTDFDPLTGHAECLGLGLSQAMQKLGTSQMPGSELKDANAAYLSQWTAESPVIITQSGTMGDPGTPRTDWIYNIDKHSAARLLATPDGLPGGLTNRHYWMGHPRPTFSKMAVISQVTGLDNSKLLPPYFPVFRGEDYLFGAMVEFLHPQSVVLEYDWCVPHFPIDKRAGNPDRSPGSGKGKINPSKYITDRTLYSPGLSTDTRLEKLALVLKELSETSNDGLMSTYRMEVAESQNGQIKLLTNLLGEDTPRTEEWRAYLQQVISNVAESMNTPAQLEDISAIPEQYDAQEILDLFRSFTADFADAMVNWQHIRKTAKSVADTLVSGGQLAP